MEISEDPLSATFCGVVTFSPKGVLDRHCGVVTFSPKGVLDRHPPSTLYRGQVDRAIWFSEVFEHLT